MPLPSFTITGTLFDLLGNVAAGEIVGNGLGGATPATVTFTSNVPQGYFVTFGGVAYRVDEVPAVVNADGTITHNGDPVQLLANDAGLSVDGLQWQCHVAGMNRFWFNAPVDGGTVNLGTVAPVPGLGVGGVAFSAGELITLLADSSSPVRVVLDALYVTGHDEYHEYANLAAFPGTGVADRIYVALDTGKFYRWTGSAYQLISETDVAAVTHAGTSKTTPVDADEIPLSDSASSFTLKKLTFANLKAWVKSWIAKADVGLGNVDNTSDVNKPVSTAQAAADALKLSISAVTGNADGTISVGSVTGLGLLPLAAAVVTTNTAPAIGKTTYYNASGGALNITLLALSTLAVGKRFAVRRDPADKSSNAITFTCAGSDAFYSSGATSFTLPVNGEQREYEVVSPAGTKFFAPSGTLNPISGLDLRYAAINTSPKSKVQVTDNCVGAWNGGSVSTVGTYEWPYTVGVAATDIQVGFGNWSTPSASPLVDVDLASVTFSAALRDASGQVYALTFNGLRSVTIPGGGFVLSDPLPIELAQGDLIFTRTFISAGAAPMNKFGPGAFLANSGGFTATTDLTATNAAAVTAGSSNGWGPVCIVGTPTVSALPRSVVLQGDSITYGAWDGIYGSTSSVGYYPPKPYYAGGGFMMRALSGVAGVIQTAISNDRLSWFLAQASHFRRANMVRFAKYAVIGYGVNDFQSGLRTAAQIQADVLTQATRNLTHGVVKNILYTITPVATSTDRWTTLGNQTIPSSTSNGYRVTYNNWMRGGCPIDPTTKAAVAVGTSGALLAGEVGHPIGGYVEVADVVESSRDSGKWKTPLRVVTDAAITAAASTLTSATATFTSADIGRDVVIAGAGAAGADFWTVITAVGSGTSVTLAQTASTTVSGATGLIGPYTKDGTHPITMANTLIGASIQSPLLALMS